MLRSRTSTTILFAIVALLLPFSVAPGPAFAEVDASDEQRLVALINDARARVGAPALAVADDLRAYARQHSAKMADEGRLHHSEFGSGVCCWTKVAENVGYGGSAKQVHQAFMGSSRHRGNIESTDYTQVGVGVERRGDTIWVTQVFRLPKGQTPPAPAPAPKPEPEPEPEPASRPEPKPQPEPRTAATSPSTPKPTATPEPPPPPAAADDRFVVMFDRIEALERPVAPALPRNAS